MSVRLAARFLKHGRLILQHFWKRDIHSNIIEQKQAPLQQQQQPQGQQPQQQRFPRLSFARRPVQLSGGGGSSGAGNVSAAPASSTIGQLAASSVARSTGSVYNFGQQARKLFIDSILSRVTTATYSAEIRERATKKLFYGDSVPFFALIGVGLASGAGILTKEDEFDCVCHEINEAANKLQRTWNVDDVSTQVDDQFNIDRLSIGPALAKGCAAVVYAATLKNHNEFLNTTEVPSVSVTASASASASTTASTSSPAPQFSNNEGLLNNSRRNSIRPEFLTPIRNMSRFVHNFGGSVDNLSLFPEVLSNPLFGNEVANRAVISSTVNLQNEERINEMANESIPTDKESRRMRSPSSQSNPQDENDVQVAESTAEEQCDLERYPLALKMMFNYDIQSNALSILRGMYKETIPCRKRAVNDRETVWEKQLHDQIIHLPIHPNIVCMYGYFCDEIRNLPDCKHLYPLALPQRIHPTGYGRNMSLYLLMKRYNHTLRNYLELETNLSTRIRLLLFAQLLEGIVHLYRYNVAHRDLKTDNILIEVNDHSSTVPNLVLSDFGCCLADRIHGLKLPYHSMDIDKGGNAALMAPEIINKQPGQFAVLNYSKADLWASGAIAYEIFGLPNPFYNQTDSTESKSALSNNSYSRDELPKLDDDCPFLVQQLILNLLSFNPSERLNPDAAANVMQLFLWAPSQWLKANNGIPGSPEILQWLLSLSTKVLYEGRSMQHVAGNSLQLNSSGRRTAVEYNLICSFLARVRLRSLRVALNWIQNVHLNELN